VEIPYGEVAKDMALKILDVPLIQQNGMIRVFLSTIREKRLQDIRGLYSQLAEAETAFDETIKITKEFEK
jgi:hypothetical protein